MNKKTFIMALCMVGHSGYAASKREQKAEQKKEMVLKKQKNLQRYQMGKNDFMKKVQMYRARLAELESGGETLQLLMKNIENCCAPSISGEERQRLLDRATEQAQKVQQVVNNFNKADNEYNDSWNVLYQNFKDYYENDNELHDVLDGVEEEKNKAETFNDNHEKFYESMRKLEATLNAEKAEQLRNRLLQWQQQKGNMTPAQMLREAMNDNMMDEWLNSSDDATALRHHIVDIAHNNRDTIKLGGAQNYIRTLIKNDTDLDSEDDPNLINDLVEKIVQRYGPELNERVPLQWLEHYDNMREDSDE